jgi:hypothetical protein
MSVKTRIHSHKIYAVYYITCINCDHTAEVFIDRSYNVCQRCVQVYKTIIDKDGKWTSELEPTWPSQVAKHKLHEDEEYEDQC